MSRVFQSQSLSVLHTGNGAVGTNALITPPFNNQRIRVVSLVLIAFAAGTVEFESGTTALTGTMSIGLNGGIVLPYNPDGWFTTAAGAVLNAVIATGTFDGVINYVLI